MLGRRGLIDDLAPEPEGIAPEVEPSLPVYFIRTAPEDGSANSRLPMATPGPSGMHRRERFDSNDHDGIAQLLLLVATPGRGTSASISPADSACGVMRTRTPRATGSGVVVLSGCARQRQRQCPPDRLAALASKRAATVPDDGHHELWSVGRHLQPFTGGGDRGQPGAADGELFCPPRGVSAHRDRDGRRIQGPSGHGELDFASADAFRFDSPYCFVSQE